MSEMNLKAWLTIALILLNWATVRYLLLRLVQKPVCGKVPVLRPNDQWQPIFDEWDQIAFWLMWNSVEQGHDVCTRQLGNFGKNLELRFKPRASGREAKTLTTAPFSTSNVFLIQSFFSDRTKERLGFKFLTRFLWVWCEQRKMRLPSFNRRLSDAMKGNQDALNQFLCHCQL